MLLDSNLLIYACNPEHDGLRRFIADHVPAVSVISEIEVLGYHRLTENARATLQDFFPVVGVLPLNDAVVTKAIRLRQFRRISMGDST